MAKTYHSIHTSKGNKHQAELKSKAKRREARAARRQYDWREDFAEEQWLLDELNKHNDQEDKLPHWEPCREYIPKIIYEEKSSYDLYQDLVEVGCTHIRKCVAYTRNNRPCGSWVGIDPRGRIHRRYTFGAWANEYSDHLALLATVRGLLKDSGLYDRVMNYEFKTNGHIFCYWSRSGKISVSMPHGEDGSTWSGDILIEDALSKVASGRACTLMIRGYTVSEVINDIFNIVESSREVHELRGRTPSKVRREWFYDLENDDEFSSISYEKIRAAYQWYAEKVDWEEPLRTNHVHRLLQWGEESPTEEDIQAWVEFSGACNSGTNSWLARHKLPSLATLREFTELFGAEMALRRFGVDANDTWYSQIVRFLEQSCSEVRTTI